jgi:ribokinase
VPAFEVDAVDTTGAGDVFHGGYVYGLLRNWGLVRTLTFASACAAMKCTKVGGRAGIPRLEEVLAFLRERNYLKSAIDTVAPNTTT